MTNKFKIGGFVQIADIKTLEQSSLFVGSVNSPMGQCANKVGEIRHISKSGNCLVEVQSDDGRSWTFFYDKSCLASISEEIQCDASNLLDFLNQ